MAAGPIAERNQGIYMIQLLLRTILATHYPKVLIGIVRKK